MPDRLRQSPAAPRRRCVVCRASAPKSTLVRVARLPGGGIVLSQDADGRGAYVHRNQTCLDEASAQPKRLGRSLRRQPPPELLESLARIARAIN